MNQEKQQRKSLKYYWSKKTIACVNYFPIEACLIWNNSLTSENEIVALHKQVTKDGKKQRV